MLIYCPLSVHGSVRRAAVRGAGMARQSAAACNVSKGYEPKSRCGPRPFTFQAPHVRNTHPSLQPRCRRSAVVRHGRTLYVLATPESLRWVCRPDNRQSRRSAALEHHRYFLNC